MESSNHSEFVATPLHHLADLVRVRDATETAIAHVIGRPGQIDHVGEFIASHIFDIELNESANHKGHDGHFLSGPLKNQSVNVKLYGRFGGLDIKPAHLPGYYLVLTSPESARTTSRNATLQWSITHVFLFEAARLVRTLRERGVQIRENTSIRKSDWSAAEIYPLMNSSLYPLTEEQKRLLRLFAPVT